MAQKAKVLVAKEWDRRCPHCGDDAVGVDKVLWSTRRVKMSCGNCGRRFFVVGL